MTSYTITKYEYYAYSSDDYKEISKTFDELFPDRDASSAVIIFTSLGILKLLEEELKNVKGGQSALIGEENHRYIIRFFDREIEDLKDELRQGFNSDWHDDYRIWLKELNKIRQRLINKAPVINK